MHKKILLSFISIFSLYLFTLTSCKHEGTTPSVKIKSITVQDEGQFDFEGGLTYAVLDSKTYQIDIETEPSGVNVFYAINGGLIIQKTTPFIEIDSNDRYISFFSTQEGACMTNNNRLDFGYQTDSLGSEISVYPNPTDSIISWEFASNIRGVLDTRLYNIIGEELNHKSVFISTNIVSDTLNTGNLPIGLYLINFQYGNTAEFIRIIKK